MIDMKCKLTIFTATYNRRELVYRLYITLKNQTSLDFEWLVVDDGSTDGTDHLFVNEIIPERKIDIKFYRKEVNSGLIRALNFGVSKANGEYFAKVDSDDYVVEDYVEYLSGLIDQISGSKKIYGAAGLKVDPNGVPLKGSMPSFPENSSYLVASDLERPQFNLDGDMAEIWKTDILKQYPFPVWKTEYFAPEQISFFNIALDGYQILWTKKRLVICQYLENGLTRGASKLEKLNPMGYAMMYNQRLKFEKGLWRRLKTAMNFIALCRVGGNPEYCWKCTSKPLMIIAYFPGLLLSVRRRRQYKQF